MERVGNLGNERRTFVIWQSPGFHYMREVLPLDQLRDDIHRAIGELPNIEHRHNGWVTESRHQPSFSQQGIAAGNLIFRLWNDLDCDVALKSVIHRFVDNAEATGS